MLQAQVLLEYMTDAVVDLDDSLHIRTVNGRAALLYRRSVDQLIGCALGDLFPELRTSGVLDQLLAARGGKAPQKLEIFVPSLFSWHSVLAVPQHDGLLLFARDISDRVRREKDEAARAAVRKVVEFIPLCVTITRGPQHRIEQANSLARALVGHREVQGELVEKVLPEAREQGFIALLDNVYATGQTYRGEEMELRWRPHVDGQERVAYFDLIYQPFVGDSGSVEGILHLGTDVTEKVERRLLIERYASERQAVLQQLEEGVILTDAEGQITFVNEAAERMHGVNLLGVGPSEYTAAYSLLTDAGAIHPPELLPLARAVREKCVVSEAVWKIRRPDGTVLRVRGNAKPILGAANSVVACVLTLAPCPAP